MQEICIEIINHSQNNLPSYETPGSSGMDIRASLEEPLIFAPLQRHLVPTGLYVQIPEGYEAQIRPRSGLAYKYGITCLNSPGTIDSDYRGEIKVILVNLSDQEHKVYNGDRIAQMIISQVEKASWKAVVTLSETARGGGGFGHTGVK